MIDNQRFGLSPRHVSVSTVGVVKNMYRLTQDLPLVNLALSLHAPSQEVRLKIVPAAAGHKIEKLMAAVDNHIIRNLYGVQMNGSVVLPLEGLNNGGIKRIDTLPLTIEIDNNNTINNENQSSSVEENKPTKLRRALQKWTGVMIEYILIDNINCLEEHAHELGRLLTSSEIRREHVILNLIPYNPTEVCIYRISYIV